MSLTSELFGPHDHGFVGYVTYGPERVANLVTPHIVGLLESQDSEAKHSLKSALALVVNRAEDRARIAAFVPARVETSVGRQAHFLWLTAWLVVDANAALDFLQRVVSERDCVAADQYFVDLLAFIHRGGLPLDQNASLFEPATLSRFLSMIYKRIRPAEDENPKGPHSPSQREDAQHQRSLLVQVLGRTTSEPAYRALLALRDGGSITERSTLDWIDELSEKAAERLGQGKVWTPAQVAEFANCCVARPGRGSPR